MSIQSEIERLQGVKTDLKNAIVESGIDVPEGTPFTEYANKTGQILGQFDTKLDEIIDGTTNRFDNALSYLQTIYDFYLPDILDMPSYEWLFYGFSTNSIPDLSEMIEFCVSMILTYLNDVRTSLGTLTGTDLSGTPIDYLSSAIDGIESGSLKWESLSWREVSV